MKTVLLTGRVQSGGNANVEPCANVNVMVCEAAATASMILAEATTDAQGSFSVQVPLPVSLPLPRTAYFASANLGGGVELVVILGPGIAGDVVINELTTVAAAYATAQFNRNGALSGDAFGLRLAAGMNDNLADRTTGLAGEVLRLPPNADQTNSLRSLHSLSNLLAGCVRQVPGVFTTLMQLTTPPYGRAPVGTFEALANLARYPGQNVSGIYNLCLQSTVYDHILKSQPDAWTLAVKVNQTGSAKVPFGGPGNVVFDQQGFAWITNNVVQGTPKSTVGLVVLQPNGKPADGVGGTPVSPVSPVIGGGILGTGFGIDIAPDGSVWTGNFGWGDVNPGPDATGSVSQVSAQGEPLSLPHGYQGGTDRAQGVTADGSGNIWIASFGNNRVVVFPQGNPDAAFWYQEESMELPPAEIIEIYKHTGYEVPPNGSAPFDIAIAFDGSAWVTNSGGLWEGTPGSVCKYVIENGSVKRVFKIKEGHALKGIALDSQGNAWVASGGNSAVFLYTPAGELVGKFSGVGGIDCPWSVAIDGNDNVWVANFGPMLPNSDYTTAALSHLAGTTSNASFWPGLAPGEAISPPTGYTLPTGGDQVRLSDGITPLYGEDGPACYSPLLRMTNCAIDQAGNVWAMNNWKPSFQTDNAGGNPGGDGVVIFVGLATPPKN